MAGTLGLPRTAAGGPSDKDGHTHVTLLFAKFANTVAKSWLVTNQTVYGLVSGEPGAVYCLEMQVTDLELQGASK